jgi:hypothetical protein
MSLPNHPSAIFVSLILGRSLPRIKNIAFMCLCGLLQSTLLLMLCMTSSWGYATSNCGLNMDPGGSYDSPQAALDAASAYWRFPFAELNEAQVCKGQWIKAQWVLDQPTINWLGVHCLAIYRRGYKRLL